MGIPSGYSRNVIRGRLPGSEIWETGFWLAEAPSTDDATNTQATAIATAFTTSRTGTAPVSLIGAGATIDEVRVYSYVSGGPDATFVGSAPITLNGTGTQTCPDQVAIVITLLTGFSGRRNRGRMFMPALTSLGGLTSGQLTSTNVTPIAVWWAGFLSDVNAAVTQPVVVLSQVGSTSNPVTDVRVDSRLDIQRRRADRIIPSFTQLETVTAP